MKKLIAVLALFGFLAGCSFDQIVQDQWGLLAIKNASRGLGYAVAQSKSTADDTAVQAAYDLLQEVCGVVFTHPDEKTLYLAGDTIWNTANSRYRRIFNDRTGLASPGEDYVRLAVGRDFADVSPLRGVLQGGGAHTLEVAVTVAPRDE